MFVKQKEKWHITNRQKKDIKVVTNGCQIVWMGWFKASRASCRSCSGHVSQSVSVCWHYPMCDVIEASVGGQCGISCAQTVVFQPVGMSCLLQCVTLQHGTAPL